MTTVKILFVLLIALQVWANQDSGINNRLSIVLNEQKSAESSQSQSIKVNWNKVMDVILDMARAEIEKQNKDEVDLPNINEEFANKVLLVNVKGVFTATKGKLNSLSSLERTGDVNVKRQGSKITISCDLGLGMLRMWYDHYKAKVNNVGSISGYISGQVGKNSLKITATLDMKDGKCKPTLDSVKVVELEGMKIKISGSGFGPLNWLITKVTNSYVKNHKNEIISNIEQGLSKEIAKAIKDLNCEKYMGLLFL